MEEAVDYSFEHVREFEEEMLVCTRCSYCKVVCPTYDHILWDSCEPRGKVILAYGLLKNELKPERSVIERLYQCTTCKSCEIECSAKVKVVDIIEAVRKDLFTQNLAFDVHKKVVESIIEYGNPLNEQTPRLEKLEKLGKSPRQGAQIAVFLGCIATYREHKLAHSVISIFDKLKVDYTVIDEVCCGSVVQRLGGSNTVLQKLATHNIHEFEKAGVKTIVTACAGCYRMLKKEYIKFENFKQFEVLHITEFLQDYDLKLNRLPLTATYHDPCHLGRHSDVYDAPRKLLQKFHDLKLVEMARNRQNAYCCGGGGGLRCGYPELAERIACTRLQQAKNLNVNLMITACTFCALNFQKGNLRLAEHERIEVKDITELIADSLLTS